jgi:phosphatidylglycerophosphate synthase
VSELARSPVKHSTELVDAASRAATDELLAGLRAGRWRPAAWVRFAALSTHRSVYQARRHQRALIEVTVLHAAFVVLAGPRGRRWTAVSWALAVVHLGMLDARQSLGLANAITLLRANLPAIGGSSRWLPAFALATDLLDGRIARHGDAVTSFGAHADSFADAVFWTWFALRHEPSRAVRVAALAAWAAPVVIVTMASIAGGRMVDAPRPELLRPAAAMQAVVAVRAVLRRAQEVGSPDSSASARAQRRSTVYRQVSLG